MKRIILFTALLVTAITFTNCSSDDDNGDSDTIAPLITVISPNLNEIYSTDLGVGFGAEISVMEAEGSDETKISKMKMTVRNSNGDVLLEYSLNNTTENKTEMMINDFFSTSIAGTYNVVFTATDSSGNVSSSDPRTFIYQD